MNKDFQEIGIKDVNMQDRFVLGTLIGSHQFADKPTTTPTKTGSFAIRRIIRNQNHNLNTFNRGHQLSTTTQNKYGTVYKMLENVVVCNIQENHFSPCEHMIYF